MALFGGSNEKNEKILKDRIYSVDVKKINSNPYQPRKYFDISAIEELSTSIKQFGILQPLIVRKIGDRYEIIAGERRLKAATKAGFSEVPVIIREMNNDETAIVALIENLQRQDLNFMEEAQAYQRLVTTHHMTQESVAERVGKTQSTVANKLRLLKLPHLITKIIIESGLTERHARALLKVEDKNLQLDILKIVIEKSLNVQQTENLIEQYMQKSAPVNQKVRTVVSKDLRLFFNTIDQAIKTMKNCGIEAFAEKKEHEKYIEYIINIKR